MSMTARLQGTLISIKDSMTSFGTKDVLDKYKETYPDDDMDKVRTLIHVVINNAKAKGLIVALTRGVYAASGSRDTPVDGEYAWAEDPILRRKVLDSHPCVGYWSPGSSVCAECPLNHECLESVASNLARLADVMRINPTDIGLPTVMDTVSEMLNSETSRNSPSRPQGDILVRAVVETTCPITGSPIALGEECLYKNGQVRKIQS